MGLVQRIAVEPHLTSRPVQVLPEGKRQLEIVRMRGMRFDRQRTTLES